MTKPLLPLLIVDDNPDDLRVHARWLRRRPETPYHVMTAETGQEGLALAETLRPTCILLDYLLPDMDGLQFLTTLKAQSGPPLPAMVMFTSAGNTDVAVKAMKLGAHDYLAKDILSEERLFYTVDNAITKAELQQKVLVHQEKLERFAHILSHDLKSSLRSIATYAYFINQDTEDSLSESACDNLSSLQNQIVKMDTMLDDLKRYLCIDHTCDVIDEVDTNQLIADTLDLLNVPSTFTIEVRENLPILHTPKAALAIVFRNLIGNAIKHHVRTDGQVTISGRDMGTHVEFAVSDDGPGIPKNDHNRIFEFFQTLAPRHEAEGSGIGLALVKKTIETHGGTIAVESSAGQGTTFRFTWETQPPHQTEVVSSL